MSLYTVTFLGLSPFGSLLMGSIARHVGVPVTFAIGGAVCVVASIVFGRRLSVLREEIKARAVADESAAPTLA